MSQLPNDSHTRRSVVALAGLAMLAAAGETSGRAQGRSVGGGIAGGGGATTATGTAQFSLFATRLPLPNASTPTVFGQVLWVDPAWEGTGLTLASTTVSDYGPLGGDPTSRVRVLKGSMSANGEGHYPFEMAVFDAGPDRFGEDTIALRVGPAMDATPSPGTATPDFFYAVEDAPIDGGDVALISFEE